jgi:transcriptional regulator with PAS, ATPase and Fis domain
MADNTPADPLIAALQMTTAMAGEQNVMTLLRQGLSLCVAILGCERGLLIAESADGRRDVIRRESAGDLNAPYSSTALRLVNEQGKPLQISDAVGDQTLSVQQSIQSQEIRSILCARLDAENADIAGKRIYLYLDSRNDRRPFTPDDLEKFRLLTALMAGLAKKSDLLERQEAAIDELKTILEEKQFEDLIFSSSAIEKCLLLAKQAAPTDVPVLFIGETGTGKEVLARIIHRLSTRSKEKFLAVNCGAIPPTLIESQLFGHEKGAFTGAVASRKGFFEEASGGTLFLDEIGELPLQAQSQFLRVLQEGELLRVGSTTPIAVDVRIVSATNVDLEKAVAEGKFRKDLFYRLNVMPIKVPAVRERGEDALLLARYFLQRYAKSMSKGDLSFAKDAEQAILMHSWPGNVREIQNRIQRAVITLRGPSIGKADLDLGESGSAGFTTLHDAREAVDRELIAAALQKAPGNLTNAAKILDIDRKSLRILLEKYGIPY